MPTSNYGIFAKANELGMTVCRYLTGVDGPLLNIEWRLQNQFARVTQVLNKHKGKGRRIAPGTDATKVNL